MGMKAAAILAALALGGATASAKTVQYQIYTLTVGNSQQSTVGGILFDGQYIWAAIENPDGGVLEKLTTSGVVVSTTGVGLVPDSIVYDGANAWVTDYDSGAVSIVSSGGQLLGSIAIPGSKTLPGSPSNPEGMAFDGRYVWVANQYDSVTKIDAQSRTVVGTYAVGRAPQAVAFDGKYIWVANGNSNAVWVLNPQTGASVNGWATGTYPTNLLYDGTNMWVSNGFAPSLGIGSVTRIVAAGTGSPGTTFTIPGLQVRGLAYDGKSIWVCNSDSNTVSRLRTPNAALMGTFPGGLGPRGAAFDGSKIWIADSAQNALTIIVPPEFQAPSDPQLGSAQVITQQAPPSPGASLTGVLHLLVDDE
jgi:YVTN family beta-propeller protein